MFNRHWEYLDELIFFEPKYPDDERKEAERLVHLKQFTKVFFRAIFDGVN